MSIAQDILKGQMPDLAFYQRQGDSLDDIDEYGFTPLIECVITRQLDTAKALLAAGVDVNKQDVAGRTPLHWAVDNADIAQAKLLLEHGAYANAYTSSGLSVLVYPLLRRQQALKNLLYHYGAKADMALDFISGKLLGHRFELSGCVDILNAKEEYIELDYEGFILEFSVAVIKDSLKRFINSYSARHLRRHFQSLQQVIKAYEVAARLLAYQHLPALNEKDLGDIHTLIQAPLLILPAASSGHAMCFMRYKQWWVKIDRGENSLKEGSINIYRLTHPEKVDLTFIKAFLYKKQSRAYFHQTINQQLGLVPVHQMPISAQISGNCSWANIQAAMPVAFMLQNFVNTPKDAELQALDLYYLYLEWDKDRALYECVERFYHATPKRKASIASMLAAVLFQACDHTKPAHLKRAEQILAVLTEPDYRYILRTYLITYCQKKLTRKGQNLLKILDDCGVDAYHLAQS